MSIKSAIAANRFGLGARPGELKKLEDDPKAYLLGQLKGPSSQPAYISQIPPSEKMLTNALYIRKMQRDIKKAGGEKKSSDGEYKYSSTVRSYYMDQVSARFRNAAETDYPFHERLVYFWSNHFAVSTDKQPISALAGAYENEVIRPNLGGKFIDLLLAAEKHPAMILYLDNERSMGPSSMLAKTSIRRRIKKSADINENLAREILELHTLGVSGGYDQADVTAFAHALTGWSVGSDRGRFKQGVPGGFIFRENIHEPGPQTIMGQKYSQLGIAQGEAILRELAIHPSTARFIATKLVRHFVADEPPRAMVKRVAKVFLKSGGDLPQVHAALVNSKEAWKVPLSKYKTPQDFVISTFRAFDFVPKKTKQVVAALEQMGQMPYRPGSPAGWPDTSDHWGGADALYKRIEWSNSVARKVGSRIKPVEMGEMVLGATFGDHTRTAVSRAESAAQGTTLLLASPDFQRR